MAGGETSELLHDKKHHHHSSINNNNNNNVGGGTVGLWVTCFFVCQAAFLFGYTSAVLNGPTSIRYHNARDPSSNYTDIHFGNSTSLSSSQTEVATGLALVGAMLGAFGVNIPVDRFGRRWVLLFNNSFYILGTALCTFCVSFPMLVVGRFIVGIGIGVSSVVVPQLLSEIAPLSLRGALASLNQLAVTLGILITNLVYFAFENQLNGWRYTIG
jgi:MFS family permease